MKPHEETWEVQLDGEQTVPPVNTVDQLRYLQQAAEKTASRAHSRSLDELRDRYLEAHDTARFWEGEAYTEVLAAAYMSRDDAFKIWAAQDPETASAYAKVIAESRWPPFLAQPLRARLKAELRAFEGTAGSPMLSRWGSRAKVILGMITGVGLACAWWVLSGSS